MLYWSPHVNDMSISDTRVAGREFKVAMCARIGFKERQFVSFKGLKGVDKGPSRSLRLGARCIRQILGRRRADL